MYEIDTAQHCKDDGYRVELQDGTIEIYEDYEDFKAKYRVVGFIRRGLFAIVKR